MRAGAGADYSYYPQDNRMAPEDAISVQQGRGMGSRYSRRQQRQQPDEAEQEEEEEADEPDEGKSAMQPVDVQSKYAYHVCRNMDPCDMCLAIPCPCIVYGETIERLELVPANEKQMMSTGCTIWACFMALSAAAIETPLLVPGACSWLPTTYLGGVLDARQLLLTLAYFVPPCICQTCVRSKLLAEKEDLCSSCAYSVFCSCCSLASGKKLARDSKVAFDEDEGALGRFMPYFATLNPRDTTSTTDVNEPLMRNSQGMPRRGPSRTSARFAYEPEYIHYFYE